MHAYVETTSPFGRRGEVVEVDPESPRVQKYLARGLLSEVESDPKGTFTGSGAPVEEPEHPGEVMAEDSEPLIFDPSEHTVAEVRNFLLTADEDQQAAVIAAEREGRARSSIIG